MGCFDVNKQAELKNKNSNFKSKKFFVE